MQVGGRAEWFDTDGRSSSCRDEATARQRPDIEFDVTAAAEVPELLRQPVPE